ncbi:hypothetical protein [Paludisphaera sp.]|uniref:hypothetical protein n=1 Tax=Paludisphaera sp. TaxID=2017432 RepID=UPI00301D7B40
MTRRLDFILGTSAVLVAGLLCGLYSGDLPMGVEGEWTWPRVRGRQSITSLLIAAVGVAAYVAYATLGYWRFGRSTPGRRGEVGWVAGLACAGVAVQVFIQAGAPDGYGLTKWGTVHCYPDCTGYYEVAAIEARANPRAFLADYSRWIKTQGVTHPGTHPPGLVAGFSGLLALVDAFPTVAKALNAAMPPSTIKGFDDLAARGGMAVPPADRAAIYLTSLITLLACAGTIVPLYLLARESATPRAAWASAMFWPLAPALILFQPLPDTMFPFLSATALALTAWSSRRLADPIARGRRGWVLATASGAALGIGMMFTLAFLPVGLIAALVALSTRPATWSLRLRMIVAIGVGFLGLAGMFWLATGAEPMTIWWWNLQHNSQFYHGAGRSYSTWVMVNLIETAVAAGLPAVVWGALALLAAPRGVPRAFWCALIVMALVNLSGRTMGEVARLWMLFLPPLFTAVGVGVTRMKAGTQAILVTLALVGLQTVGLQAMIQLVYPLF